MNKRTATFGLVFFINTYLFTPVVYAETISPENNICQSQGIIFGFLNGVQTTSRQARINLNHMKYLYGDTTPKGEAIRYELLYNQTNGFSDFVEVFEQRLLEQDIALKGRFELFFEALRDEGTFLDKIKKAVPNLTDIFIAFKDRQKVWMAQKLTTLFGNPPTLEDYKEHQSRIDHGH